MISNFKENIASIENLDPLSLTTYKKLDPKAGKVFTGPNWTAYKRENLGSIPRPVENIIIKDPSNDSKLGFFTRTERFMDNKRNTKTPGPGSYISNKNTDISSTGISFYSSKGYGNGFVSQTMRFNDRPDFESKYMPGPGSYAVKTDEHSKTFLTSTTVNTNKTKPSKSLKQGIIHPGPCDYNPVKLTAKQDKSNLMFNQYVSRKQNFGGDSLTNPGPGYYFREQGKEIYSKIKYPELNNLNNVSKQDYHSLDRKHIISYHKLKYREKKKINEFYKKYLFLI